MIPWQRWGWAGNDPHREVGWDGNDPSGNLGLILVERWEGGNGPHGEVGWVGMIPWEWFGWSGAHPMGKVGWDPSPDSISTLSQASELAERGEPGAIPDRQRILPERPRGAPGNVHGLWPHRPE